MVHLLVEQTASVSLQQPTEEAAVHFFHHSSGSALCLATGKPRNSSNSSLTVLCGAAVGVSSVSPNAVANKRIRVEVCVWRFWFQIDYFHFHHLRLKPGSDFRSNVGAEKSKMLGRGIDSTCQCAHTHLSKVLRVIGAESFLQFRSSVFPNW